MPFRQQADLPRQRERRMPAMDEDGLVIVPRNLHDGIDERRIRREGIEKRLHFDACEMEIPQIMLQIIVCGLTEIGVDPLERNHFFWHLSPSLQQFCVQMSGRRA